MGGGALPSAAPGSTDAAGGTPPPGPRSDTGGEIGPKNPAAPARIPAKARERAPASPPGSPSLAAASPPAPPPSPAPEPARIVLPEGARIVVALAADVRSSAVKRGDRVALVVGEDALIEGTVVVRRGSPATGEILDVQRRNVFGGGGRLVMTVLWTTAVDGQEVRLRPVPTRGGGRKVEGISLAPEKPEKAGRGEDKREIVAPAGTSYNAWVDSSKEIAAPR
jgi:hypothetical protein